MGVRRTTVTLRAGAWSVVEREALPGESVSGTVCRLIEAAGYQKAAYQRGLEAPKPETPKPEKPKPRRRRATRAG